MPTKWRSYRDHRLCDVTSPYVYLKTSQYKVGRCDVTLDDAHDQLTLAITGFTIVQVKLVQLCGVSEAHEMCL